MDQYRVKVRHKRSIGIKNDPNRAEDDRRSGTPESSFAISSTLAAKIPKVEVYRTASFAFTRTGYHGQFGNSQERSQENC